MGGLANLAKAGESLSSAVESSDKENESRNLGHENVMHRAFRGPQKFEIFKKCY